MSGTTRCRPAKWAIPLALLLASAVGAPAQQPLASPVPSDNEPTAAPTPGVALQLGANVVGPESFVKANAAYEEGRYDDAIALYRGLAGARLGEGIVDYNLGNAHLRSGDLGSAVAAYRRALSVRPRDQDLLANLDFARKSAKDALSPPQPDPVVRTLFFWHFALSPGELLRIAAVLNVLFWLSLAVLVARRSSEFWRWTVVALLVLLIAVGGSLVLHTAWPRRVAVVLPQEVDVHSGLSHETVVRFKLHAGSEVAVREVREGWVRIALPDGQQGWIERGAVVVVGG